MNAPRLAVGLTAAIVATAAIAIGVGSHQASPTSAVLGCNHQADQNADCYVNSVDLLLVAQQFGPYTPGIVTPTATFSPTANPSLTSTPPATPTSSAVEDLIAERGDHQKPHDVHMPEPMYSTYSWGQHGTEDTRTWPGETLNAWIVMHRDAAKINNDTSGVRFNVRNLRCYVHSGGTWALKSNGLPSWAIAFDYSGTNNGNGNTHDVFPRHEPDGTDSYAVEPGNGLHLSNTAPGGSFSNSDGVACRLEARALGTVADIANAGICGDSGADFRDAAGTSASIKQAGTGWCGALGTGFAYYYMLSSTMTDAQIRALPPPL